MPETGTNAARNQNAANGATRRSPSPFGRLRMTNTSPATAAARARSPFADSSGQPSGTTLESAYTPTGTTAWKMCSPAVTDALSALHQNGAEKSSTVACPSGCDCE